MYNAVSGETVTYSYDSLNRIATAGGSGWGEAYTFDGFGNLTAKTVTAGSGPSMSVVVSEATNRIGSTDANGNTFMANAAYDVENHTYALVGASPYTSYSYDAQNKRVFTYTSGSVDSYGNPINYLVVLYSVSGQKMGTYQISTCDTSMLCSLLTTSDQYFGGRRLASIDQLGSVGTYYPWGEAKGTTNPQDTWSYATYWRDSATGLDYANNRYYTNAYGRFMTPDPSSSSGGPSNPQSWNRYAYTSGDPVNRHDPRGLWESNPNCPFGGDDGDDDDGSGDDCGDGGGGGGGGDPCAGADGFTPSPSPYCQVGGPVTTTSTSNQTPDRCHIEVRFSQIVIQGVTTIFFHTMLVGIDDTTGTTLGVIDGWPSPGFINLPLPNGPVPILKLTTGRTVNGIYNNANAPTTPPYVDTASTAAMCAAWAALVALADNFPNAIYGGLTSNSNSLTTFLWAVAGGPTIGPPAVPCPSGVPTCTPGWGGPIFWVP